MDATLTDDNTQNNNDIHNLEVPGKITDFIVIGDDKNMTLNEDKNIISEEHSTDNNDCSKTLILNEDKNIISDEHSNDSNDCSKTLVFNEDASIVSGGCLNDSLISNNDIRIIPKEPSNDHIVNITSTNDILRPKSNSNGILECNIDDIENENLLLEDNELELNSSDELSDIDIESIASRDDILDNLSLDALMLRKTQLMNSIQKRLSSQNTSVIDDHLLCYKEKLISGSAEIYNRKPLESDGYLQENGSSQSDLSYEMCTSTPIRETVTPASKVLNKWHPSSFMFDNNFIVVDEVGTSDTESVHSQENKSTTSESREPGFVTINSTVSDTYEDAVADFSKTLVDCDNVLTICNRRYNEYSKKEDDDFEQIIAELKNEEIKLDRLSDVENLSSIEFEDADDTLTKTNSINDVKDEEKSVKITENKNDDLITNKVSSDKLKSNDVTTISLKSENANKTMYDLLILSDDEIDPFSINYIDEDTLLASDNEDNVQNNISSNRGSEANKDISTYDILMMKKASKDLEKSGIKNIINESIKKKEEPVEDKELPVFISKDPEENKDNNDEKWDYLRNLGNDYDRYKAVRKRWQNVEIPNPKRDLTLRHARFFLHNEVENKNRSKDIDVITKSSNKRLQSESPDKRIIKKHCHREEPCCFLFEYYINQLKNDIPTQITRLQNEHREKLQCLAENQQLEKNILVSRNYTGAEFYRLEKSHTEQVERLMRNYQNKREETLNAINNQLMTLKKASAEIKQLHEFYPDEETDSVVNKNSMFYLNADQVQEILDVDKMLCSYYQFYR